MSEVSDTEMQTRLRHGRIHHKFEVSAIHAKYRRALNDIHEEAKLSLTALVRDKPHVVEDKLDHIASMTEQLIGDSLVAETKRKMEDAKKLLPPESMKIDETGNFLVPLDWRQ